MSLELPLLRLGLAGFSEDQRAQLQQLLGSSTLGSVGWQVVPFGDADAWWVNGARMQLLADGTLRVASGVPGGRSTQLDPREIDRPIAFALPLPRHFEPVCSFRFESRASVAETLARIEGWLRPLLAQFWLASQVLEQEAALGSGVYHVSSPAGQLLAVVNMRGDVGVLPSATALDFEQAMWMRRAASADQVPEGFVRSSLALVMWQYAERTTREVLPRRYRSGLIYFRRPPRLPQRLLRDSHLLVLRELARGCGTFTELQQRTRLPTAQLEQDLGALYLVGAITTNPNRAGTVGLRRPGAGEAGEGLGSSVVPSGLGAETSGGWLREPRHLDPTAPAPLRLE